MIGALGCRASAPEELENRMAEGLSLDTAEAFCGYYNTNANNPMLAPELGTTARTQRRDGRPEFASDYHNWYGVLMADVVEVFTG